MAAPASTNGSLGQTTILHALSDDLFDYLARYILSDPKDISRLSRTCSCLYLLLEPLVYRADVLRTKHQADSCHLDDVEDQGSRRQGGGTARPIAGDGIPINTALHWAISQTETSLGLAIAQKSIKAALKYWPDYLRVRVKDSMSPIQLAASRDRHAVIQELIEAGAPIDAHIWLSRESPLYYKTDRLDLPHMMRMRSAAVNALSLAMLFGNVRAAEVLAYHTQDLADDADDADEASVRTIPSLKLAAVKKMPSVIRILRSRGYSDGRMSSYFYDFSSLELATIVEDNEETLEALLDTGSEFDYLGTSNFDALTCAGIYKRVSNAIFIVRRCPPEQKPVFVVNRLSSLLQDNEPLPIIKDLFEGTPFSEEQIRGMKELIIDLHVAMGPGDRSARELMRYLLEFPAFNNSQDWRWTEVKEFYEYLY
ncbi:hypothetical protein GGS26DRAFT_598290 [Hypomontagnella submonticulosa]|nr:hypothetical protein GGS26DRAFT_598290 [Hypomontagnella submonticulosa]